MKRMMFVFKVGNELLAIQQNCFPFQEAVEVLGLSISEARKFGLPVGLKPHAIVSLSNFILTRDGMRAWDERGRAWILKNADNSIWERQPECDKNNG